ncbi:hypothetical protein BH09ACT6_BH09ACT6_20500 [soil metagenome]
MHRFESTTHTKLSPAQQKILGVAVVWGLAWKAASLWRAARDENKPWFAALFVVNSVGFLDALYLFVVSPLRRRATERKALETPAKSPGDEDSESPVVGSGGASPEDGAPGR